MEWIVKELAGVNREVGKVTMEMTNGTGFTSLLFLYVPREELISAYKIGDVYSYQLSPATAEVR